jgi:Flp pilus assembly protein TadB
MTRLLAAGSGASIVTGLLLIGVGLWPPPDAPTSRDAAGWVHRAVRWLVRVGTDPLAASPDGASRGGWPVWRWPLALVAGLTVLALSGWPVAGALVACAVVGLPILLTSGAASAQAIAKAEAVEEWTRRLSDVLVAGVGLEPAITATVRTCPPAVEPAVTTLAAHLAARRPIEEALHLFADDLDDATGDLVAATLILGSRRRGPGLAKVLTALADSLADEVTTRRKVEAERAKPRTTARAVTLITLAVLAVGALNSSYLRPYGTPLGQAVLGMLATGYAAALWWMHTMTHPTAAPRILGPTPSDAEPGAGEEGQ